MREKVEIDGDNRSVVGDGLAGFGPVVEMARPEVVGVQVSLGFGESEFVGNVGE